MNEFVRRELERIKQGLIDHIAHTPGQGNFEDLLAIAKAIAELGTLLDTVPYGVITLKLFDDDMPCDCSGCGQKTFGGYTDDEDTVVLCGKCYTDRFGETTPASSSPRHL